MTNDHDEEMLAHILLPVANPDDATSTARAIEPYAPDRVTVLHVVETGGSAPDKTPVEYSKEVAANSFAAVRTMFPECETQTAYGTDIVDAILEASEEVDASAIVFRSRGGNRLLQFLAGDRSLRLVTEADRPVIAVPSSQPEP